MTRGPAAAPGRNLATERRLVRNEGILSKRRHINDGAAAARRTQLTWKLCGIWKLESGSRRRRRGGCFLLSPPSSHRQIPLRHRNLGLDIDWIGSGRRGGGSQLIVGPIRQVLGSERPFNLSPFPNSPDSSTESSLFPRRLRRRSLLSEQPRTLRRESLQIRRGIGFNCGNLDLCLRFCESK